MTQTTKTALLTALFVVVGLVAANRLKVLEGVKNLVQGNTQP